jgi:shikimate dehydrogenase
MPRLAVLGYPVAHSRSPAMHNAALAELGLAPEWTYEAIEVAPDGFDALVRRLAGEGFAGVNVTVPHKLAALAAADEAGDAAREIGAANTLTFRGDTIVADNTDATGILDALPESPAGKRALVMGAGGSARAAVWGLRQAGAEVHVWNRTAEKAEALAREFSVHSAQFSDLEPGEPRTENWDLILNATTVGLETANAPTPPGGQPLRETGLPGLKALPIDADAIHADEVVVDLVYGTRETELIAVARAAAATTVDGLEVLVRQGAASLRIWTGGEPPLDVMRDAARGDLVSE